MDLYEERILRLEQAVRNLTDQLDLIRLTASYAPAVDGGADAIAAGLWQEDGIYDVDVGTWTGQAEIAEMVRGSAHRSITAGGAAHVISLPHLSIAGDAAVGTCYSLLFIKQEGGYGAWRIAANRWEFERGPDGWRIKRRINRLLDGSEESRALLRAAFNT